MEHCFLLTRCMAVRPKCDEMFSDWLTKHISRNTFSCLCLCGFSSPQDRANTLSTNDII